MTANNILDGGVDTFADTLNGALAMTPMCCGTSPTTLSNDTGGTRHHHKHGDRSLAGFADIENLVLLGTAASGTGNALANTITGNSSSNTLNGGLDSLVDVLAGGGGDDVYDLGASIEDQVAEDGTAGSGTDTILSSISRSLANFANVENLTLDGSATEGTAMHSQMSSTETAPPTSSMAEQTAS